MEIDSLARFAVAEHNKKENAVLQFGRVVTAEKESAVMQNGRLKSARRSFVQNVVAGHLWCMTLEATDAGKKKVYKAQVWEKPWLNFKELQKFKLIGDASSGSSSA